MNCGYATRHDHLRKQYVRPSGPLDSVIAALDSASCRWCLGLLRLLKSHLESHGVPAFYDEVQR